MNLILASASPRRLDLLRRLGYTDFSVIPSLAEELQANEYNVHGLALKNAVRKAAEVAERFPDALVIGADTLIEFEHRAIGKPADTEDAVQTLLAFSGKTHCVTTGVCLRCREKNLLTRFAVTSEVDFKVFDRQTAEEYVRLVPVLDKAGAYAVQDHGEMIIAGIRGSYDNIVGLPSERLAEALTCALAVMEG